MRYPRKRMPYPQQHPDDMDNGPLLPEREERAAIELARSAVYRRPPTNRSPPLEPFLRRPRWSRLS